MEVKNSEHGHLIEVSADISNAQTSQGKRICSGAVCGFADATTSSKDAQERSASMRKLLMAVVLCVLFMSVEVVGGIKANSLAILTDAAHLLSDVAAFAISLFSLWASGWEATPRQSYGFFRIEILGALVSIQMIWLLAGILVYEAIVRIIHETGDVNGFLMFAVAAFGLVVNILMAFLLGHDHGHGHGHGGHDHGHGSHGHGHGHGGHGHGHGHGGHGHGHGHGGHGGHGHGHGHGGHGHGHGGHGHGHSHDHEGHKGKHSHDITITSHHHSHGESPKDQDHHHHAHDSAIDQPLLEGKSDCNTESKSKSTAKQNRKRNINVQGAYLHVLGDSIQSIGVMISGGIIWFRPEWKIIDLICTLFFSVIVLGTTINMLRNILEVLMESTPREIDATKLEQGLCQLEEVLAIHELHIWAITVGKVLLACHVKITPESDADAVLDKVIEYIEKEYNISHVTIQIER